MWTRKLLKDNAKIAFQRNYWTCVLVSLVLAAVLGQVSMPSLNFSTDFKNVDYYFDGSDVATEIIAAVAVFCVVFTLVITIVIAGALVAAAFLTNIVELGGRRYFMENREHKTPFMQLFYGFTCGHYKHLVGVLFQRTIRVFCWTLLFIVPGIIKSYEYLMIPYIMAENPELSRDRAFEISSKMMDGRKGTAFKLDLSFIGWNLLSAIAPVGVFWVFPYKNATYAEFYAAIKAEAFQKGITNAEELPGVAYPVVTDAVEIQSEETE